VAIIDAAALLQCLHRAILLKKSEAAVATWSQEFGVSVNLQTVGARLLRVPLLKDQ